MKSIQDVSKQTLQIESVLKTAEKGEMFTYERMEDLSGVKMDAAGKGYLNTALRRLGMVKNTIRGVGFTTLDKTNAVSIVSHGVIKIDNATRRAEKTTKLVQKNDVYNELSDMDKKHINTVGAMLGSIRAYSTIAIKYEKNKTPLVSNNINPQENRFVDFK